jgi:hypothetical protein
LLLEAPPARPEEFGKKTARLRAKEREVKVSKVVVKKQ